MNIEHSRQLYVTTMIHNCIKKDKYIQIHKLTLFSMGYAETTERHLLRSLHTPLTWSTLHLIIHTSRRIPSQMKKVLIHSTNNTSIFTPTLPFKTVNPNPRNPILLELQILANIEKSHRFIYVARTYLKSG